MAADVFSVITGQDEAVALLRRAVATGRIAHAYAFVGPAGSGRRLTAVALAKALAAAGDESAAARIERGVHPDVRVIEPTPPARNPKGPVAVRVEDIRELEHLAGLRPVEAPWKVFIVDGADRMTGATPQAFLKTLEEPPGHTVIILILSQLRALPATVLSRCQIVRFRPRREQGALALLPGGGDERYTAALQAIEQAAGKGAEAILRTGENVGRDRPTAEALVEGCWLHYRDLLCREGGAGSHLSISDAAAPARALGLDRIVRGLVACREAWQALEGNVSPRLTVEVLLSRLTSQELPA